MLVLSGGFFDAGGGPSCDMNADAERGVVPMMTAMPCILSGSWLDTMPTTSRPLVVRIVDGSARPTFCKRKERLSGRKIAL